MLDLIFYYFQSASKALATMPGEITSRRFTPSRDLSEDECKSLVVGGSKASIEEYLHNTGWNGAPGATISAHLNTDNSRILKTSLNLFGALKGDFFSAAKLWPEMPPAFKFKLQFENLAFLDFANRLTTNLMNVTDNMLEVKYNETPSTIDAAKEAGMGDLSFRTVCVPVSADYIKVTAIGFPMTAADLQERFPAASNPLFPGFSILNKDVLIMPAAQSPSGTPIPYGSTFLPLIIKGNVSSLPLRVLCSELRSKTFSFLRDAYHTPTSRSIDQLKVKWSALEGPDGENNIITARPKERWPVAKDYTPDDDAVDDLSGEIEGRI